MASRRDGLYSLDDKKKDYHNCSVLYSMYCVEHYNSNLPNLYALAWAFLHARACCFRLWHFCVFLHFLVVVMSVPV